MNRARRLLKLAAKSSPNGAYWPDEGPVRVRLEPPVPLYAATMPCEIVAEVNPSTERVSVRVVCGVDLVGSLEWLGGRLGWSLRVVDLPDGGGDPFRDYLARIRDAVEEG